MGGDGSARGRAACGRRAERGDAWTTTGRAYARARRARARAGRRRGGQDGRHPRALVSGGCRFTPPRPRPCCGAQWPSFRPFPLFVSTWSYTYTYISLSSKMWPDAVVLRAEDKRTRYEIGYVFGVNVRSIVTRYPVELEAVPLPVRTGPTCAPHSDTRTRTTHERSSDRSPRSPRSPFHRHFEPTFMVSLAHPTPT